MVVNLSMIWRDDDIGEDTRLDVLTAVDDLFQRYSQPHTIAVMARGIDTRPDLIDLILRRRMDVQLHCWRHDNLVSNAQARDELRPAVRLLRDLFGPQVARVLYPPWNRSSVELEEAAGALGMTVSTAKISLSQYIRAGGDVEEDVVNFHHWHVPDALQLEPALRIAA